MSASPAAPGAGLAPARLWRLARADFLERARRPGFLVALAAMAYFAHGMLPAANAGYHTFGIAGAWRPAYGPGAVGALVGMLTGLYFVLVGFYLVRGSIERDRRTGVGEVLGATPLGRLAYVLSRWLSHVLVFSTLILVAVFVALTTQQLLGEDAHFAPLATALPVLGLALPAALVVAAAAVLLECLPVVRGGAGNVVWFFAGLALIAVGDAGGLHGGPEVPDLLGVSAIAHQAYDAVQSAHPELHVPRGDFSIGVSVDGRTRRRPMRTFAWPGLRWSVSLLAARAMWSALALALVLLAAACFDRFARPAVSRAHAARRPWPRPGWLRAAARPTPPAHAAGVAALTPARRGRAFVRLLLAESTLMAREQRAWWWFGLATFAIAGVFAPVAHLRAVWLPLASIWPLFALSPLGTRERMHGATGVLFSVASPVARPLAAAWGAGALAMLAVGATGVVHLALAGEAGSALGWLLGCAFVPALALALGVWTGGRTAFEALYLALWYVGPMHHVAEVDYTGVTVARPAPVTLALAALTLVLAAAAAAGRAGQVRR